MDAIQRTATVISERRRFIARSMAPNVAIERPSKWAKPACEGPARMACWAALATLPEADSFRKAPLATVPLQDPEAAAWYRVRALVHRYIR